MIKVALFGSGWIQDLHARAVVVHPGGELVAVANWRPESAAKLAERHGIPRVTTDWEALAADPEVDAAIVATPNALHAAQAIALLRNGKHVMVEKPMATTVAECGASLDYMLDVLPLREVLAKVLSGSGECAKVDWRFLGLTMPAWVLIGLAGLGAFGVWANASHRPRR